ncbi:hypothetical protein BDY19DRAFT_454070 [Irpex rosettiformis]|uniref:Uncharacterized protein n=1 Tax=Irpex rosettiformis TaxID=378272 RepID=A0ACB8TT26_9APHY|nr:hypothetical protein BDY19DRAFT_454070 [Irpex rosettiformis]
MPSIPWEKVTANTLRNVCRDLGIVGLSNSRDEMSAALQRVEDNGLEKVLQEQETQPKKNTRAAPKTAPHTKKSTARPSTTGNQDQAEPRRSGREPRLTEKRRASIALTSPSRSTAASSRRRAPRTSNIANKKALFDGVVLPQHRRSRPSSKAEVAEENNKDTQRKSFAQLDADTDEPMQVSVEAT